MTKHKGFLSAHKAPVVHKWLLAHPRFQLHFTPTYSSGINQVERWFAELERRCLERGVFCSLDHLKAPLESWIKVWNEDARPFKWTKTADQSTATTAPQPKVSRPHTSSSPHPREEFPWPGPSGKAREGPRSTPATLVRQRHPVEHRRPLHGTCAARWKTQANQAC